MKKIKIPSHPDVAAQTISSNPMAMIAFQHVMLQSGIVPITTVGSDVNKLLKEQGVSEEDQRVLKRKFRKLWRSAAKRVEKSKSGTAAIREARAAAVRTKPVPNAPEDPVPPPNRFHKEARKALVFMTLRPQIQTLVDNMVDLTTKKELQRMIRSGPGPPHLHLLRLTLDMQVTES
jgi:hypothetical protein